MSLPDKIKSFFDRVVTSNYDGPSTNHPIICLNALKNVLGDNRQTPSQPMLDAMAELAERFPQRTNDQAVLDRAAKDDLGLTVFISDLEDACQTGNPLEMETEAARLQWVSENGLGGLEVLIEVALQDFDRLGLFAYHLQRANAFNQDVKKTWPYTRCLLREISKSPLPEPHDKVDFNPSIMDQVPSDRGRLKNMAAARRLWDGDYIRINGIQREVSNWLSTVTVGESSDKNIVDGLEDYIKNSGNFFIQMAENLIGNPEWETKIIQLEALRYFAKNGSPKNLSIISSHLKELT